jgi:DNA-directed RNA polymerase subunit E"
MIVYGNVCPNCKSTSLSEDFTGVVIVLNPEVSEIAKKAGITKPGRYALKVR